MITKEASIDLDQEVKKVDPDYGAENIKSIRIKALKLELLDQFTDANFKALEKISVAIDAEGETEKELASYVNSDFTTDKYTLAVPNYWRRHRAKGLFKWRILYVYAERESTCHDQQTSRGKAYGYI